MTAVARAEVLIDPGVGVARFDRLDAHHALVARWMAGNASQLLTVAPVLAEGASFLPVGLRDALAALAARGVLQVQQDQDPD